MKCHVWVPKCQRTPSMDGMAWVHIESNPMKLDQQLLKLDFFGVVCGCEIPWVNDPTMTLDAFWGKIPWANKPTMNLGAFGGETLWANNPTIRNLFLNSSCKIINQIWNGPTWNPMSSNSHCSFWVRNILGDILWANLGGLLSPCSSSVSSVLSLLTHHSVSSDITLCHLLHSLASTASSRSCQPKMGLTTGALHRLCALLLHTSHAACTQALRLVAGRLRTHNLCLGCHALQMLVWPVAVGRCIFGQEVVVQPLPVGPCWATVMQDSEENQSKQNYNIIMRGAPSFYKIILY
jgi:hypothetical protein